eukprot:scaffold18791_cov106-Isochrysis_galbana.AAC.9
MSWIVRPPVRPGAGMGLPSARLKSQSYMPPSCAMETWVRHISASSVAGLKASTSSCMYSVSLPGGQGRAEEQRGERG